MLGKLIILGVVIVTLYFAWEALDMGSYFLKVVNEQENYIEKQEVVPEQETIVEAPKEESYVGQVFEKIDDDCLISIPDKARTINGKKELTYILPYDNCEYDVNDYVEVVFGGELVDDTSETNGETSETDQSPEVDDDSSSQPTDQQPETDDETPKPPSKQQDSITVKPLPETQLFETMTLTTTRQGYDVVLKYNDTSDNTLSVTVTLRNSERIIFSGEFKSSKFETLVKDVKEDTAHIIEMTIDHATYGKVYSSVFNPAGNNDNTISGVFKKQ